VGDCSNDSPRTARAFRADIRAAPGHWLGLPALLSLLLAARLEVRALRPGDARGLVAPGAMNYIEWTDAQEAIAKLFLSGLLAVLGLLVVLVIAVRVMRALGITWRDAFEELLP